VYWQRNLMINDFGIVAELYGKDPPGGDRLVSA